MYRTHALITLSYMLFGATFALGALDHAAGIATWALGVAAGLWGWQLLGRAERIARRLQDAERA